MGRGGGTDLHLVQSRPPGRRLEGGREGDGSGRGDVHDVHRPVFFHRERPAAGCGGRNAAGRQGNNFSWRSWRSPSFQNHHAPHEKPKTAFTNTITTTSNIHATQPSSMALESSSDSALVPAGGKTSRALVPAQAAPASVDGLVNRQQLLEQRRAARSQHTHRSVWTMDAKGYRKVHARARARACVGGGRGRGGRHSEGPPLLYTSRPPSAAHLSPLPFRSASTRACCPSPRRPSPR